MAGTTTYTLHAPPGSFRAFKALIAAEYNAVDVTVADFDADAVRDMSPTGKAPLLQTPRGEVVFESNAIARFLANVRTDTGIAGRGLLERAAVDAWVDFAATEVELPASVWFYPVVGYMPFHQDAYEKAKADISSALSIVNAHLNHRTYLVGEQVTLADICVASALVYPMKFVCDKSYLKPYQNVVRWFTTCVNQPQFRSVVGEVHFCKTELMAPGQAKPAAGGGKKDKRQEGGKKDKKKEKAAPALSSAKKAEHQYKVMDEEHPSEFVMGTWKKTYSNAKNYEDAMKAFWDTFDKAGWSLWHQNYNHNDENKKIFMCSNAIGGFQQRSDEIRRWAFGVMDVLGTEDTSLEIKGVWLLRGDTVQPLKDANDDANWYTWTKLAGKDLDPTDEVKAQVAAYWCNEKELEGKPIQDSKVFK